MWRRFVRWLGDTLPGSPQDQEARDSEGRDQSAARQRRLKLHMLEKRGKGGFR
jgi:hypothetical protein